MTDAPRRETKPPAKSDGGATRGGPSRRGLLKKGVLGAAILFVGGSTVIFFRGRGAGGSRPRQALRIFTTEEYEIFAAVAARICPAAERGWPSPAAVDCAGQVDSLMAELHPEAAADFRRLLHVFQNGVTGLFSIGRPNTFTASTPDDQNRRLESWRRSRLDLFRSGYQAMKRLAHATYYASPETYARVGYPGPPVVPPVPS